MAVGLEEILDNLLRSQKFFRSHLNGIEPLQWDWKPFTACRSIREILVHWADSFAADDSALFVALELPVPDINDIQAKLKAAGLRYADGYRRQYVNTPMDAPFRNGLPLGTVLASLNGEDNYHAGQIAYIRLAADPNWDWVKAVHQTPGI